MRKDKRNKVYIEQSHTTDYPDAQSKASPVIVHIREEEGSLKFYDAEQKEDTNLFHSLGVEDGRRPDPSPPPARFSPAMKPIPLDTIVKVKRSRASPLVSAAKTSSAAVYATPKKGTVNSDSSEVVQSGLPLQDAHEQKPLDFSSIYPATDTQLPTSGDFSVVGRAGSALTKTPLKKELPQKMNHAILLLKPHADTAGMQYLVTSSLESNGVKIVSKGRVSGSDMVRKHISERHFREAIRLDGEEAPSFTPDECRVSEEVFGENLEDAVRDKRIGNGSLCREALKVEDDAAWMDLCRQSSRRLKLRKGLHLTRLDAECVTDALLSIYPTLGDLLEKPVYVINAFLASQRAEVEAPTASTHFFHIEWDGSQLPWRQFLENLIGCRDPSAQKDPPFAAMPSIIGSAWASPCRRRRRGTACTCPPPRSTDTSIDRRGCRVSFSIRTSSGRD